MKRWSALVALLCFVPLVQAQDEPETLLPATTQFYLRWDGVGAHKLEYAKTALGKMMAGEMGTFIQSVFNQLQEAMAGSLTADQLLQGVTPEKLKKIQEDAKEAPKALGLVIDKGFILAGEVRKIDPPQVELTLIIPNAGDKTPAVFGVLRLIAALTQVEVKESKYAGKTAFHLDAGPAQVVWWQEGKHAVVVAGTEPAETLVKRRSAANKEARLPTNAMYKKVAGFKEFPTGARGFLDLPAMVKGISTGNEELGKVLGDIGLTGIKAVTFYSGFDGAADRGLVEIDASGPRKGILSLASGKSFKLSDVPPLPTDVTSWSMTNFNAASTYDSGLQVARTLVQVINPESAKELEQGIKQVDEVLGLKLRDDLLAHLDDKVVVYNSPAEGLSVFGQTFLIKVKNAEKLEEGLNKAIKNVVKATGANVTVKKRPFHEAEIREIIVHEKGFFFVPSYTIYKGWLAVSFFPQAIQGFVMRTNGELPAWKPSQQVQGTLDKLPKEFISISYSDPVPSVTTILSMAPMGLALINSLTEDLRLDTGALPNAHDVVRHLFPNLSVITDKDGVLRMESRSSLDIPIDLSGFNAAALLMFAGLASRF